MENTDDRSELLSQFEFERVLNIDQSSRRIILCGKIRAETAVVLVERAAFQENNRPFLENFVSLLTQVSQLGANDIYSWFMASARTATAAGEGSSSAARTEGEDGGDLYPPSLKINLIYPCPEKYVRKYTRQSGRSVVETPAIYAALVRPFIEEKRAEGSVNWVYNILDGKKEQEKVFYRDEQILLTPDLNWDQKTLTSLHLLGLAVRRDLWTLRDLKKEDLPWLRNLKEDIVSNTIKLYPALDRDQLKLFFHYQPTYYHLHIHIMHVQADVGQNISKAVGFDAVVEYLSLMGEGGSMADISLTYSLGEESELWRRAFLPLRGKTADDA